MSKSANLNNLERVPSVLPAKQDAQDGDIVLDVGLNGHMASLSLNEQQSQFQSPQSQQLQQLESEHKKNQDQQKNEYNIKQTSKKKNNSDKKPLKEKPIEFCAVEKLKTEQEEMYDSTRFAMEMVQWGTGANDPESLSAWFKEQIDQMKDLKDKEVRCLLNSQDYPKLIQTNCLLQWSIGKIENIW